MDHIQGYGLWCGFATDCVKPQGDESSRFQCAHADVTVQLPESLNYCRNTRAMGCAFTSTIVNIKRSGGEYEICEFLLLSVSSWARCTAPTAPMNLEHSHGAFVDPWQYPELRDNRDHAMRITPSEAAIMQRAYRVIPRNEYNSYRFYVCKLVCPAEWQLQKHIEQPPNGNASDSQLR
jgi:hypothetical protein